MLGPVFCVMQRDMRPEPNATSAQAQLEATGERYLAFPTIDPKITFLDALDVVLSSGIGSPFHAKEIDGLYVMHSKGESDPRPAWVITLRGLPPMEVERTRCAWNSGMAKEPYPECDRRHDRKVLVCYRISTT